MSALFTGKHKELCECSRVCAINNQGLLWLHRAQRCGNAYTWKALPLASFKRQMEDTGDTFSDLRWNTNCLHKSHEKWQTFQRQITRHKSLAKHFLSFSFLNTSYLLLPSFILDCLIPDGRQWSQDTKHKARRRRFIACWESEQKKVSLSGKGIMFFNYLAIWLCCMLFFRQGCPISFS